MKNSTLILFGGAFALLIIGLFFSVVIDDFGFYKQQVSNPAASTGNSTNSQEAVLFAWIVVVGISIFSIGVITAVIMWFLSGNVKKMQEQPNQPFPLLAGGVSGGEQGESTLDMKALVLNNLLYIVVGIGAFMVVVTLLILLAF